MLKPFAAFVFAFSGLIFSLGHDAEAQTYQFSPIFAQVGTSGPTASTTFVAKNVSTEMVALEVKLVKRSHSLDGVENRVSDDTDFIISPPQMVLKPGQSQSVRVQYVGDPKVDVEQAYRILVNQVSIDFEQKSSGAKVLVNYNYEVAFYVTPAKAKPEISLVSVEKMAGENGRPMLGVTLESKGNTRAILSGPQLSVTSKGKSVALSGDAVKDLEGAVIMAKSKRRIALPWPAGLPDDALSGQLKTDFIKFQ